MSHHPLLMVLVGATGFALLQVLAVVTWRARTTGEQHLELPKLQPPCPGLEGKCVVRPRGHVQPCWDGTPDADRLRRL